jgi:hypothetical protein
VDKAHNRPSDTLAEAAAARGMDTVVVAARIGCSWLFLDQISFLVEGNLTRSKPLDGFN